MNEKMTMTIGNETVEIQELPELAMTMTYLEGDWRKNILQINDKKIEVYIKKSDLDLIKEEIKQ